MSDNLWNTPEALAYFEHEYACAIKGALEKLAKACARGGPMDKMTDLEYDVYGVLHDNLGAENYQIFFDLLFAAPLVREFLEKRETGKL